MHSGQDRAQERSSPAGDSRRTSSLRAVWPEFRLGLRGSIRRPAVVQGLAIGAIGAARLTRSLRALLYEVSPVDPPAIAAAALLLVGALAAWRPARRAASIDPVQALRAE